MRTSIVILAAATAVAAQSPLIEEYAQRYDFWLNPPSACSSGSSGCVALKCGTGQCQFGKSCGTWAGMANTCCEARHGGDTFGCGEFEDLLKGFNLKSGGDAADLTESGMSTCPDGSVFLLSNQDDRTRSYCCPFGKDGVVAVDYGQFLNNLTIQAVRCIPGVRTSTGGSDSPSTTASSGSPARTSTGATGSSTPNSANTLKNVFALAPIAFMALAAL
ncbi:hypothetical protein TWF281_007044 [Arthrobotrys megalospora]